MNNYPACKELSAGTNPFSEFFMMAFLLLKLKGIPNLVKDLLKIKSKVIEIVYNKFLGVKNENVHIFKIIACLF